MRTRRCPFGSCALRSVACDGGSSGSPRRTTSQRGEMPLVSGAFPVPPLLPLYPGRGWCAFGGGPSTGPTACPLVSRCRALWGWRETVPWGGAPCRGSQSMSSTCSGRRCAGVGARYGPFGVCAPRGAPRRGGGCGRPSRGGVTSHCCEGRPVSGAFTLLAALPWGQAARRSCPCFLGVGGVGVDIQHRPHSSLVSQRRALWGCREGVPAGG